MMATFVARCSWLIVPTTMLVTPEVLSTKFRFFLEAIFAQTSAV